MPVDKIFLLIGQLKFFQPLVRCICWRPVTSRPRRQRHRDLTSHNRRIDDVSIVVCRLFQNLSNVLQRQRFPFTGPWIRARYSRLPLNFEVHKVNVTLTILRRNMQCFSKHIGLFVEVENGPYRNTSTGSNFSFNHSSPHAALHSRIAAHVAPATIAIKPLHHPRHSRSACKQSHSWSTARITFRTRLTTRITWRWIAGRRPNPARHDSSRVTRGSNTALLVVTKKVSKVLLSCTCLLRFV